jgi:tellurite resistance-related uncharacterized protein
MSILIKNYVTVRKLPVWNSGREELPKCFQSAMNVEKESNCIKKRTSMVESYFWK